MNRPSVLEIAQAAQLEAGKIQGNEHFFRCPRHDDREPRLRVNLQKKGFSCKPCGIEGNYWEFAAFLAGVSPEDRPAVTKWMRERGLLNSNGSNVGGDLPSECYGCLIERWYEYTDEQGRVLYYKGRYKDKKGEKQFVFWCQGSSGLKGKNVRRVPYRLHKFIKAEEVHICEGESDVEAVERLGYKATTNDNGAGNFTEALCSYFRPDQKLIVHRDNDDAGLRHQIKILNLFYGKVASLKPLHLEKGKPKGDVRDWIEARNEDSIAAAEELARLIEGAPEWEPTAVVGRDLEKIGEDRYRLSFADSGIVFEVDRLRRDRHELIGELCVKCSLAGARTYDGALSIADFNLSSARARTERANLLRDRSQAELDWTGLLEEFCQRVLAAERDGQPAVDLKDLPKPAPDDNIRIEGIVLPRRHPTIVYGDGGAAKSYTGLYLAGRLCELGFTVALFDWELAGEDHRDRLERLFGEQMPRILYARCERPLVYETDRLRRIVFENGVNYALFDSVAFACDGPPESAEVAGRYFRSVRQIGGGSLHIAHITKGEGGEDKPFGSVFWHNGARTTYFLKRADTTPGEDIIQICLYNKKANLGRLRPAIGFEVSFGENETIFRKSNPADNDELASKLPMKQRIAGALKFGAMSYQELAEELNAKPDTISKTVRRGLSGERPTFTLLAGDKVGLLQ